MKKLVYLLIAVFLILALFPAVASAHTEDDPFTTELIAGQHIDVGEVSVWNDGDYLYVKYKTTDGWCLTETHLHVATSLEDIPQQNGNPPPGQFDYQMEHDCVTEYIYEIPLDWGDGQILYIAAHAVVTCPGGGEETAWGAGYDFPGKNWATYFTYTVQGVEIPVEWPKGGTVTVAFEDLPFGEDNDYDYNDWVADIDTLATFWGTAAEQYLLKMDFTIIPEARGAWYDHEFHMLIPATTFECQGSSTLILYDGDDNVLSQSTAPFDASLDNDFFVIPLTSDALPGYQQVVNTDEDMPYVTPERTATLSIVFDALCPFDFDAYVLNNPANMHGEGLFFDPWLHVIDTGEDIHRGDPRMLTVPVDWLWPEERVPVWEAYDPGVIEGDPPTFEEGWWGNPTSLVYEGKP